MLSLAKAHKDYYLQKLGEISPREDYYLKGGTASGHWHGSGAEAEELDGRVTVEGLVRLFDGQHPKSGEQLGVRLRTDGVAAWDLTFSADKSLSLLWAFGDDEIRRHVVEAFEEATAEAVAYLESVASSTRGATRTPILDAEGQPVLDEQGRERQRVETWPIRTSGYLAAWFTEFTSRADDPQLHTHVVVGNRVKGVDGKWRSVDGRLLYRHKLDAGYLHEAELRARLTERLGVDWEPVVNGMADIKGVTRTQIEAFSRRRQQIEEWRTQQGLADTPAVNEVATLATRTPKRDHPLKTLESEWFARGAQVGVTPESIAGLTGARRVVTTPHVDELRDDLMSPTGLTRDRSTFTRGDVVEAVAARLSNGGHRSQVEAIVDQLLQHPDVVPVLPNQPANVSDSPELAGFSEDDVERMVELATGARPIPLRKDNGELFPGLVSERRYTTAELVATEQRIIDRAINGRAIGRWHVIPVQAETVIEVRAGLTAGQQNMVRRIATSGDSIEIGIGAAGTGKTTVMGLIGALAATTGTPIFGTALAARAAAGFEEATSIPSFTLTRFIGEAGESGGLPHGSIVIVDEAAMVGTRQLARVSDLVEASDGKLILIGDHRQLAEIDAGGLFPALAARLPSVELTENIRQANDWERTALTDLREGSVSRAVAIYRNRQRINTEPTLDETISRAVAGWHKDVQEVGDVSQVLLLAHQNQTVDRLNRLARQLVAANGHLTGPQLDAGSRTFQAGDRVVCSKNHPWLGVLNGDSGTITSVHPETRALAIRLDRTSTTVKVPGWYLDEGYVDWGYALTGHKAQGTTARRSHTVAEPGVDREWVYVTMSRGQTANTLYLTHPDSSPDKCGHLAHDQPDRLHQLLETLQRSSGQLAAIDTGRGPQTLTNTELANQLDLHKTGETASTDETDLARLAELVAESEARHQDRLAETTYQPPGWIVEAIGERPAYPRAAAVWDNVVDLALRYQYTHCIEDVGSLIDFEPQSQDVPARVAWLRLRRNMISARQRLESFREMPERARAISR